MKDILVEDCAVNELRGSPCMTVEVTCETELCTRGLVT